MMDWDQYRSTFPSLTTEIDYKLSDIPAAFIHSIEFGPPYDENRLFCLAHAFAHWDGVKQINFDCGLTIDYEFLVGLLRDDPDPGEHSRQMLKTHRRHHTEHHPSGVWTMMFKILKDDVAGGSQCLDVLCQHYKS